MDLREFAIDIQAGLYPPKECPKEELKRIARWLYWHSKTHKIPQESIEQAKLMMRKYKDVSR